VAHGDLVAAPDLPNAKKVEHWYFISGVDVLAPEDAASIVTLGDSITDGHGATTDANDRWPDVFAQRLQASPDTRHLTVLNHGIGGNRLLLDEIGPNALARFERDVIAQPGVRFLIVLEGINDLGMLTHDGEVSPAEHESLVHRMIGGYEQMITRAHAHAVTVIGCTIMPDSGFTFYHPGPRDEADRQAVNAWIRGPGHFDAVIDFDAIMRDPEHPDRLLPRYDSGDHLHPSPAGYAAMGNAVPLTLFTPDLAPQLAFTFDDLPAHGPLPPGETRLEVITKVISALQKAGLPPIFGFVNGQPTQADPSTMAVLQAWRSAGYPLGNHTWSHMNLNQHSLAEFEGEIIRNEPLLDSLMKNEDWRWLRFPFLAEGDTPEKKSGIRAFLARHGYKAAGVTMSFGDYLWNEPYARCKSKADSTAIAELQKSYLEAAADTATYERDLSHRIYGHDIPYVLLMHVGALDAEMLPTLLGQYRAEGFEFITLQQAESDEFYRNDVDLTLPSSADSLEQVAAERGIPLPQHTGPNVDLNSLCR
jgi:lysophospholipase L1-like esterase